MIYLYFDKTGTLKEVINDESIRRGATNVNGLAVYCELWDDADFELDDIWYCQRVSCGKLTPEVSFIENLEIMQVPYKKDVDYTYFKDFKQYKFYVFEFTTEYTQYSGLNVGTVRFAVDDGINALGTITFNIQDNVIKEDNNITQSQYDYLLLSYASRTLNEETGRTLCELIEDIVKEQAKITGIEYVGTTTEILALTEDLGIALSTTNAHIYYWDEEQGSYVDSEIEFMDVSLSSNVMTLSGSQTVSGAKTFTGTQTFNDTIQANKIKGKNNSFSIRSKSEKAIIGINDEDGFSTIIFHLSSDGILFSDILTLTAYNGDFVADFNGSKVYNAVLNDCQSETTPTNAKDIVNKSFLDTVASGKADLNNSRQNIKANKLTVYDIRDLTDTSEIEMVLGGINFYAKKWDNPSLYREIDFYYDSGLLIDEPTNSKNPTTKNYVDGIRTNLQSQIDGINAAQNLADIVADLTALNNLSTTNLKVNDKVQVLVDSDHDDGSTVYNWNGSTWVYIGKYGQDGYTKAQADTLFATKQEVANIKDGTTIDSFADVETALATKLTALTDTSWAERVYTVATDGTQSVRYISLDSLPNSVVLRNSTGALNCADAVYDSHALNMGFYKATFQPKQHQIIANVNDGVSNFKALITIVSPSTIIDTATLLKTYFTNKGFNFANTTKYAVQNIYISKLNVSENGFDENSIGIIYDSNTQTFTSPNISNGATLTIVGVVSDTVKAI